MSATIYPGALITMDPSDKRVIVFDFDSNIADGGIISSYVITIDGLKQRVDPLTSDNDSLLSGSRKVSARFLATTATRGDRYQVSCKVVTDETPSQQKEYSITILIQDH